MKKRKTNSKAVAIETDGAFLLKIVLYIIVSSIWIKFTQPIDLGLVPLSGIPVGLFLALFIASRDKFQIDRKLEYVVIIIMTILTYFIPAGIVI